MAEPVVLCITRSAASEQDPLVLLQVSSAGPASLDLKLLATESIHPYVASGEMLFGNPLA